MAAGSRLNGWVPPIFGAGYGGPCASEEVTVFVAVAIRGRTARFNLARRGVGRRELRVGGAPDAFDAATRSDEQGGRCQCDKCHQKRIFDKILALLVIKKSVYCCHIFLGF